MLFRDYKIKVLIYMPKKIYVSLWGLFLRMRFLNSKQYIKEKLSHQLANGLPWTYYQLRNTNKSKKGILLYIKLSGWRPWFENMHQGIKLNLRSSPTKFKQWWKQDSGEREVTVSTIMPRNRKFVTMETHLTGCQSKLGEKFPYLHKKME